MDNKIREIIDNRFESGNEVPVPDVRLTRSEWEARDHAGLELSEAHHKMKGSISDMLKQVFSNEELKPGRMYVCVDRETFSYSLELCGTGTHDEPKYLGNRIWASDDNNQALERWMIYGPIEFVIPTIALCPQHGGYGFQSDCHRCHFLKSRKS